MKNILVGIVTVIGVILGVVLLGKKYDQYQIDKESNKENNKALKLLELERKEYFNSIKETETN